MPDDDDDDDDDDVYKLIRKSELTQKRSRELCKKATHLREQLKAQRSDLFVQRMAELIDPAPQTNLSANESTANRKNEIVIFDAVELRKTLTEPAEE